MTLAVRTISLALATGTLACYSDLPLVATSPHSVDSRLLGNWYCRSPDPTITGEARLDISHPKDAQYRFIWREPGAKKETYTGHESVVGGESIMSIRTQPASTKTMGIEVRPWIFARYKSNPDGSLKVALIKEGAFDGVQQTPEAVLGAVTKAVAAGDGFTELCECHRR